LDIFQSVALFPSKHINYRRDGNQIRATYDGFISVQESPAGFGETEEQAAAALAIDVENWPALLASRKQIKADDSDEIPQGR
jgi:hypothetical protein